MKKYTEAIHAKHLLKMLEAPNPCCCSVCPVKQVRRKAQSREYILSVCELCATFVKNDTDVNCPCIGLGKEEAIKRTWITLEEKGYI